MLFFSQKKIINQQLLWYGYFNKLKINENWVLNSQLEERQFYSPNAQYQFVFRSNLDKRISENINASLGFVLFLNNPNDPNAENKITVPELRTDFGFNSKKKYRYFTLSHRYKLEARFFHNTENNQLANGFSFSSFRFRYQLGAEIPLPINQSQFLLMVKDEAMFNMGNKIVKNVFDQNRIYVGLHYKISKQLALEAGYMNLFQQTSAGDIFYNRDIIRFSIFHDIDLNK